MKSHTYSAWALALALVPAASHSLGAQECAPGQPIAIVGADLLTMSSDAVIRAATVVVRDGRVAAINPPALPAGVCNIDARGHVLVPGLTDMHVHTNERELPLFLANGVTTIRELNGSPAHLALRDRIVRGEIAGPAMLVASTLLVGAPLQYRHRVLATPDEARQAVREIKDAGYDYVKVYDALTRPVYDALVDAARALRIPLDGHIPADVGLGPVLDAGQSLQHMDKIAFAVAGHVRDTAVIARALADARARFAGTRAWVTPTLASLRALDAARTTEYADRLTHPSMAYVDSASLGWWRSLSGTRTRTGPSPYYRLQAALVPVLRDAGVRFLLGTDAANPLMGAGFSVHDELAAMVADGGLSPYEALSAATRNVGAFVGDSLRGRIAVGAPADLVLVNRNPLDDLATLRTPVGVMARGRWFSRTALDAMLRGAKLR